MKHICEICQKEFGDPEMDEDYYCEECLELCKEQGDILNSEEARYFGVPYKLQIWTDELLTNDGYGEVEITCANYSTVCFKNSKDSKTYPMNRENFVTTPMAKAKGF